MEPQPLKIAIIGAGISGLALAQTLTKCPHLTYTIYESRPSYAEIGAGIGFHTNDHRALELISPDLWANYQEHASFNGSPEKRSVAFNYEVGEKGELEGKQIVESIMPEGYMQSSIHRKHLLEVLVKTLDAANEKEERGRTVFGKKLVEVKELENGGMTCIFADGTSEEADLVVSCDGIKSACRNFVFGADNEVAKANFTGKIAYRGLVSMEKASAAVGEERARHRQMYFGHHRHMLTFGVAKGTMMNIVAFHSTETWEEASLVQRRTTEDFLRDFNGWGKNVTNIISIIENPEVWAIFNHLKVSTFHRGHLVLIGDAAHTTSPHFGQGGGMSVEDAAILGSLLGHCKSSSDISPMLKAYDVARVERTCAMVAAAREQGKLCDFETDGIGNDLEKIQEQLSSELRRWMWNYDVNDALRETLEIFEQEKVKSGVQ